MTTSSASLLPMPNSTFRAPASALSSGENSPPSHPCVRKFLNSVLPSDVLDSNEVPKRFTAPKPGSCDALRSKFLLNASTSRRMSFAAE